MASPKISRPNSIVSNASKISQPMGYTKGYSFVLGAFLLGTFSAFTLYRFQFLDFNGVYCSEIPKSKFNHAAPGECFYFLKQPYKFGIILHLACILPASLLACFQFMPFVRRRVPRLHRIKGRIAIILSVLATAGVFIILPRSFGGGLDIIIIGTALAFALDMTLFPETCLQLFPSFKTFRILETANSYTSVLYALFKAYASIKNGQVEQHRVWMLRAWFWAGCIITERIIQIGSLKAAGTATSSYTMPCDKIDFMLKDRTLNLYPECAAFYSGENIHQSVEVRATLNYPTSAVEAAAALDSMFGKAFFWAFLIHIIAAEAYIRLSSHRGTRHLASD
ncbi:hypothetical protein GGR55DRAFT_672959 [Xylaria sp. FL0064]|nr:hypothetical protein GGR55DRAFT_672959 [Xylaria sp. FL0064]